MNYKEKLNLYRSMLRLLTDIEHVHTYCKAIQIIDVNLHDRIRQEHISLPKSFNIFLPELSQYLPYTWHIYAFPYYDKESRIDALRKAIEYTENKINEEGS